MVASALLREGDLFVTAYHRLRETHAKELSVCYFKTFLFCHKQALTALTTLPEQREHFSLRSDIMPYNI